MEVAGALHGNMAVCPKMGEYKREVPCTAYMGYLWGGEYGRKGKGTIGRERTYANMGPSE